jgi:AbrB family looped-hinge helix DNA binding protein
MQMRHSTVTRAGRTTIPCEVRKALNIKPGDKLQYAVEGDHATIRLQPGLRALKGALSSGKGNGLSFVHIREAARADRREAKR